MKLENFKTEKLLIIVMLVLIIGIVILGSVIYVVNHINNKEITEQAFKEANEIKEAVDKVADDIDDIDDLEVDNKEYEVTSKELGDKCYRVTEEEIKKSISEFKNFGEISIKDSVIFGLKEVTLKNTGEVFYTNCDGSLIFVGAIIDKQGNNLTKQAMDKASQVAFNSKAKDIDKSLALKIGEGDNELFEFTDVDCPYCRSAEISFEKNPINATRYIYFFPLDNIHPQAERKSIHILCSENPAEEMLKVMKNELTDFPNQCEEGIKKLAEHRKLAEELGVSGTPTFFLNGQKIVGADPRLWEMTAKKETATESIDEDTEEVDNEVDEEDDEVAENVILQMKEGNKDNELASPNY